MRKKVKIGLKKKGSLACIFPHFEKMLERNCLNFFKALFSDIKPEFDAKAITYTWCVRVSLRIYLHVTACPGLCTGLPAQRVQVCVLDWRVTVWDNNCDIFNCSQAELVAIILIRLVFVLHFCFSPLSEGKLRKLMPTTTRGNTCCSRAILLMIMGYVWLLNKDDFGGNVWIRICCAFYSKLRLTLFCLCNMFLLPLIIVSTHFSGGRNYKLKWVFLFCQFWAINIFIVEVCEWYHYKARPA